MFDPNNSCMRSVRGKYYGCCSNAHYIVNSQAQTMYLGIDNCAASDRANFFEANLDQWLGVGSSEENCFEWNVQVSRHNLLPTPLSLSRALALLRVRVCSRIA